jgi:DNA topoisomerase VI subunit A
MERSLDVLKRLEKEGFTLTPQEDGSISGELLVQEGELERGYERAVSLLKS